MRPSIIPGVVQTYLDRLGNKDTEGVLELFTEDAVVVDESQTHTGKSAIRNWLSGTASEYTYTSSQTGYELPADDTCVVHIHLSGNFPGGEADLTSTFTHADGRIMQLKNR